MTTRRRQTRVTITAQHTLSKRGWLAEQPEDFQDRMKALAHWRRFRAGEDLYLEGDEPNAVFGLETGLLNVAIAISSDEMVNIWRAQPGYWFGDSALLSENDRGLSITAHTDSLLLVIPSAALKHHLSTTPQDYAYFYRLSHANVMLAVRVLSEMIALPPRARFARLLLRLASDDGVVQATQSELGGLAGMSRAAFRRSFSELIADGFVKTEYGAVRILDRAALSREAEGH